MCAIIVCLIMNTLIKNYVEQYCIIVCACTRGKVIGRVIVVVVVHKKSPDLGI